MMPIDASAEEAVIEILQRTGPCCLDDLVMQLPRLNGSTVFVAVDQMSRDGRLLLRRLARLPITSHSPRGTYHPVPPLARKRCHHDPAHRAIVRRMWPDSR